MKIFVAKYTLRLVAWLSIRGYELETIFFRMLRFFFSTQEEKDLVLRWEWGDFYYDDSVLFPFLNHVVKLDNVGWEHDEDGGMLTADYKIGNHPLPETLCGLYESALDEAKLGIADSWDHSEQWYPF